MNHLTALRLVTGHPAQHTPADRPAATKAPKPLTAAFVRTVEHSGKLSASGRPRADHHQDGMGLYLQVMPSGSKQWVQRIMLDGTRRDVGLGGVGYVSLTEARAAAARNVADAHAYRRKLRRGEPAPLPPFARPRVRRTGRAVAAALACHDGVTFGEAWEACIQDRSPGWKNPETDTRSWRADLNGHLKSIAGLPVAAVTVDTLRQVMKPLTPATAKKVLRRCGTALALAKAEGHVVTNAARDLTATRRGLNGHAKQHRAALPWRDVPAFYARLAALGTPEALALGLVVLTALRSKEGREARYEEIDFEAHTWTVPGDRMKDGREFRVPLSKAALGLLDAAGPRRKSGLVFAAPRGGPLADKALRAVLAEVGVDATVHGMRSSFRDWAAEAGVSREIAEECLSHAVGSSVERAYKRADLLERRREVMEQWGRLVEGAG